MSRSARLGVVCVLTVCVLIVSMSTVGCGDAKPALAPVRGRIVMGGVPVKQVIVNFAPTGETAGSGALGATDEDGRFELTDVRGEQGAHPGTYRIHLYPAPHSDSSPAPTDVVSAGGGGIPEIYVNPNNSPLAVEIPPAGGVVDVELTPDGRNTRTAVSPLVD